MSVSSMSLLKYFKPKDGLPDPSGPLSQSLPSRVIAAANSEVAKAIAVAGVKKRGEYHK